MRLAVVLVLVVYIVIVETQKFDEAQDGVPRKIQDAEPLVLPPPSSK